MDIYSSTGIFYYHLVVLLYISTSPQSGEKHQAVLSPRIMFVRAMCIYLLIFYIKKTV